MGGRMESEKAVRGFVGQGGWLWAL